MGFLVAVAVAVMVVAVVVIVVVLEGVAAVDAYKHL